METSDIEKLKAERDEAISRVKALEEEKAKMEYRIKHLVTSLEEAEGKTKQPEQAVAVAEKEPRNLFVNRIAVKKFVDEKTAKSFIGKKVIVCGWVKTLRLQGGGRFAFVELNDGSSYKNVQIVVSAELPSFASIEKGVGTGTSLWAEGQVIESPGKGQLVEIQATSVKVLGECSQEAGKYPLAKGRLELEFLRTIAHLRPRTNTIGAVARVRNALAFATHLFFQQRGFLYVHTPIITASDCEGAGEMFQITTLLNGIQEAKQIAQKDGKIDFGVDFFGKPAYMTVSGQLNGETYACALSNIYTFGPTFRAENSHTTRHLAEFWMIEPEIAFADLQENMEIAEAYLKFCVKHVLENCGDDMDFFNKYVEKGLIERLQNVLAAPFQRITYTEAVKILEDVQKGGHKFEKLVAWGVDLASEHERYLTEKIFKKPTIITDYPKEFKSFYMKLNEDGRTVRAMDILVPKIGEIIGGSQREEVLEVLERRIDELKLNKEAYSWYLDLRRYGSVPHSGFGLGFERLILFTTGVENIRDVIPFPRWPGHAEF